jgi:hypothetical protein
MAPSTRDYRCWPRASGHLSSPRLPHSVRLKAAREWTIRWLGERQVEFWIIDPFARSYGGQENDNTEVGRWCEWIDEIKRKAGVVDCLVSTHTGWSSDDRSRGATRLSDWADSLWRLNVDKKTDVRYFSAFGRGVDVPEFPLKFDQATGRLSRDEIGGSRTWQREVRKATAKAERQTELKASLIEVVRKNPGINVRGIRAARLASQGAVDATLAELIEAGQVEPRPDGTSVRHYLPAAATTVFPSE